VAGPAGSLSDYLGRIPILAGGWLLRIALLAAGSLLFLLRFGR